MTFASIIAQSQLLKKFSSLIQLIMGACGSKEVEKSVPKTTGRPVGTGNKKRNAPVTKKQGRKSKVEPIKGQKLGSTSESVGSASAKEMAAKAAEDRLNSNKKRNEKGQLGKKLAEDKKKSRKDRAMEEYNQKSDSQLVYD